MSDIHSKCQQMYILKPFFRQILNLYTQNLREPYYYRKVPNKSREKYPLFNILVELLILVFLIIPSFYGFIPEFF